MADEEGNNEGTSKPVFPSYGELNPWVNARIKRSFDADTTKFSSLAGDAVSDLLQANAFVEQERYRAEVIYAYRETNVKTGFYSVNPPDPSKQITHVIARITELHPFPIPSATPTANDPSADADWDTINKFYNSSATFVAEDDLVNSYALPQPGEEIWVTYERTELYEGGIYLGPLDGTYSGVLTTESGQRAGESVSKLFDDTTPRPGLPTTPLLDPIDKGELPELLVPGSFIVMGDSQAYGKFGEAVQKRLKEYGLRTPPGWTRKDTAAGGRPIDSFLPKALSLSRVYYQNSKIKFPMPKVDQSLKLKPKNVILILGANSSARERPTGEPSSWNTRTARRLVDYIKNTAGPDVNIIWITPSFVFDKRPNRVPKDGKWNKQRRQVGAAIQNAVAGDIKAVIHAQDVWPDQPMSSVSDSGNIQVHFTRPGGLAITNKIFPPVKPQ